VDEFAQHALDEKKEIKVEEAEKRSRRMRMMPTLRMGLRRCSVYSLYLYKITNTDAEAAARWTSG
jgi:hypothetical protein